MKDFLKVLIVEDDNDIAEYIKSLLETFLEGEIKTVTNGKDAISYAFIDNPDLILMDIILEGDIDGIETTRRIKNNHDIPIIYMTSNDDESFLENAKITDPFGYMIKPIEMRELQAIVTIALQQYNNKALLKHDRYISQSLKRIYHPLIITDEEGIISSINEASLNMFGVPETLILNKKYSDFLDIKIRERVLNFKDEISKAKQNEGFFKEEEFVSLRLPNGGIIPISLTFSMINNDLNEVEGVCIMIVDLTQQTVEKNQLHQKQLEAAELLIRERVLKEILDMGKDINQSLIYNNAIEERLHTVVNRIVQFANFKIAHISLKESNKLYTLVSSKNSLLYLNYPNEIPNNDPFLNRLYQCFENKNVDLWEKSDGDFPSIFNKRVKNIPIHSVLILPLCISRNEDSLGVITIASSDEFAFDIDIINYFEEFANDIAVAISLQRHRDEIEELKLQRENNYEQTILSFVQMIEERDIYTKGHSERVANYSKLIALKLGFSEEESMTLYRAAILHDIGKIQTPDQILLKPENLSENEYPLIKEHVNSGVRMLKHIDMYKNMIEIIAQHHEHYDGNGYPQGLKNNEILKMSRIMSIADAYDAMTTNRIYRKRLSKEEALIQLSEKAGTQFDPAITSVALDLFHNIEIPKINELTEIEPINERSMYFFQDSLTKLYNEEYLTYYIQHNYENLQSKKMYVLKIKGLKEFNNTNGWTEGSKIIEKTSEILLSYIRGSESIGFRAHGNKLLIIDKNSFNIKDFSNNINELFAQKSLSLNINKYDLDLIVEEGVDIKKSIDSFIC